MHRTAPSPARAQPQLSPTSEPHLHYQHQTPNFTPHSHTNNHNAGPPSQTSDWPYSIRHLHTHINPATATQAPPPSTLQHHNRPPSTTTTAHPPSHT
ncbi:hypothetical protein M011DRAFT_468492 [Sporormia fimetaria CBS 119925]|uniref:Uncharacterized protein n=1 Tax=Sporormia fimetaria CBS 119925 TaxID=1340428 RepID=A0A6A6V9M0_9PLEO|nr:hypothetical protein M011DRAFT_468492 [Sporormia fimetaria CBS 119925]